MTAPIHVGCSGWQYGDWRERFYPKGLPQRRWLEHYAQTFATVEVNSTFYRLARPGSVAAWLEQTPPDFIFTLKGSQYLTRRAPDTWLDALPPGRHAVEFRLRGGSNGRRDLATSGEVYAYFNNDWEGFAGGQREAPEAPPGPVISRP